MITMKKILFLTLLLGAIGTTNAFAQPSGDPASMLQQMKERQKPGLMEKVGLTEAQAEKVIEINFESRMSAGRELREMNEADRTKKMAEMRTAREKKIAEFLTAEQIKALNTYYEEMRKNMPARQGN